MIRFTNDFTTSTTASGKAPTILLIIDPQNDFHEAPTPDGRPGSLAVKGSNADAERIAKLIREHVQEIDEIFVTLDSHHKKHIAHEAFWKKHDDNDKAAPAQLAPYSQLSHDPRDPSEKCLYVVTNPQAKSSEEGEEREELVLDKDSKWYPKDISLKEWVVDYSRKLQEGDNHFRLTIWPNHCLIGTLGHAINPKIQEALAEWSRHPGHIGRTIKYVCKGMNCLTEMYSAIQAEVPITSDPSTMKNSRVLGEIQKAAKLLVCGQAKSHCVNYTVRDIYKYLFDPKHRSGPPDEKDLKIGNVYILEDGMSPVPGYTANGEEFVEDMRRNGMSIILCEQAGVIFKY